MESVTKHWSRWDEHDMSRAHAELVRLRAALKPFAKIAEHYKGHGDDGAVLVGLREIFVAERALSEGQ